MDISNQSYDTVHVISLVVSDVFVFLVEFLVVLLVVFLYERDQKGYKEELPEDLLFE